MQSKLTRRDLVHLLAESYELLDESKFQALVRQTDIEPIDLVQMMNDNAEEWESIKDDVAD